MVDWKKIKMNYLLYIAVTVSMGVPAYGAGALPHEENSAVKDVFNLRSLTEHLPDVELRSPSTPTAVGTKCCNDMPVAASGTEDDAGTVAADLTSTEKPSASKPYFVDTPDMLASAFVASLTLTPEFAGVTRADASEAAASALASTTEKPIACKRHHVETPDTIVSTPVASQLTAMCGSGIMALSDAGLSTRYRLFLSDPDSTSGEYYPAADWKRTSQRNFTRWFPGFGKGIIFRTHEGGWKYGMDGKYSKVAYDTPHIAAAAFKKEFGL